VSVAVEEMSDFVRKRNMKEVLAN